MPVYTNPKFVRKSHPQTNRSSFRTLVFSDLAHPPRALGSENVVGGPPAEYLPTLYPKASQHLVEKFRSGSFLDFDDQ